MIELYDRSIDVDSNLVKFNNKIVPISLWLLLGEVQEFKGNFHLKQHFDSSHRQFLHKASCSAFLV